MPRVLVPADLLETRWMRPSFRHSTRSFAISSEDALSLSSRLCSHIATNCSMLNSLRHLDWSIEPHAPKLCVVNVSQLLDRAISRRFFSDSPKSALEKISLLACLSRRLIGSCSPHLSKRSRRPTQFRVMVLCRSYPALSSLHFSLAPFFHPPFPKRKCFFSFQLFLASSFKKNVSVS